MSSRSSNPPADETVPGFSIRRDGGGVKMDWRTLAAIVGAALFIGGAYYTLKDHGKRLDSLTTIVSDDHNILVELRAYARATERARTTEERANH